MLQDHSQKRAKRGRYDAARKGFQQSQAKSAGGYRIEARWERI